MIARKLIAAALFSALATGAAFAQATTNAPPKPGAATPPPAVVAPATTPAKPATANAPAAKPVAATPAKPAPAAAAPVAPPKPAAAAPAATAAGAKINLNTATAEELDKLPQIGPARAKAIVEARAKGKFKNWDDFVTRKIVPSNAVTAIQNQVSF